MDFADLLHRFTTAVEAGDGPALGALFTQDGVYHDSFYGAFQGPQAIAEMLARFHRDGERFRWTMHDPVSNGSMGHSRWWFSYSSRLPGRSGRRVVVRGMSRYHLQGGQIARYEEVFDTGLALWQLQQDPQRTARFQQKLDQAQRSDPEAAAHYKA